MKTLAITIVIVFTTVATAGAQCYGLEFDCPNAVDLGDTITVAILITNCAGTVTSFGLEVTFDPMNIEYLDMIKGGMLLESWIVAEAILLNPTTVRMGGFDTTGIGVVSSEQFASLRFLVVASDPQHTPITIEPSSLIDDLVGFDVPTCNVAVPIKQITWGFMRSLYR